jgi:hypothetical protein
LTRRNTTREPTLDTSTQIPDSRPSTTHPDTTCAACRALLQPCIPLRPGRGGWVRGNATREFTLGASIRQVAIEGVDPLAWLRVGISRIGTAGRTRTWIVVAALAHGDEFGGPGLDRNTDPHVIQG